MSQLLCNDDDDHGDVECSGGGTDQPSERWRLRSFDRTDRCNGSTPDRVHVETVRSTGGVVADRD
jgi:hypothetical protein